jgi:chromosome segregation ATPase
MTTSDETLFKLDKITSLITQLQQQQEAMEERLNAKIDIVDNKFAPLNLRFTTLDNQMEMLDHKVDTLDDKINTLNHQLDMLDHKVETLDYKIEAVNKKIDSSQKDTIDTLTAVIETGYNMHEKRIKRLEEHTKIPS